MLQVKERRKRRDLHRKQRQESELLLKQAQREAEAVVKREERIARERAIREERLLDHQIRLARGQLREQRRSAKRQAAEHRAAIERELEEKRREGERGEGVLRGTSPAILRAEEILASERERQQTRLELEQQLQQAEAREARESMRLQRRMFSAWYQEVLTQKAKLGKAMAVRHWRLMAKAWGSWRRHLAQVRVSREMDLVTMELQKMRR